MCLDVVPRSIKLGFIDMATTSFTKKSLGLEPAGNSVPPGPPSTETTFIKKPKLSGGKSRKRDIPEGLWTKCPKCATMVFDKELDENLKVCPKCQHHFTIGSRERIHSLVETCSFEEMDADMQSVDILEFTGVASYKDKLEAYQRTTMLKDAVITGIGRIGEFRVALGVMDFGFLGGSMGSVVGEKLTRLIEAGTEKELPVIIISTSGGARMYEGLFSLMQMAKTSAALAYHKKAKLPYISVLTNPTYAGVMASFASLGDIIIGEPGAMVGFAGTRVIEQVTRQKLPSGFQTSEFALEHGMIDMVVPRKQLRDTLGSLLSLYSRA